MDEIKFEDDDQDDGVYGEEEEDHGRCPVCGSPGEMLNHGKNHWMVCHDDKVKWRVGSGFFSIFQRDWFARWDQAGALLKTYREVTPATGVIDHAKEGSAEERFRRMLSDDK